MAYGNLIFCGNAQKGFHPSVLLSPANLFQHMRQHGDAALILIQIDMFVRRVIQAGVTGTVGDDGAAPGRADHIHIGGAGFV